MLFAEFMFNFIGKSLKKLNLYKKEFDFAKIIFRFQIKCLYLQCETLIIHVMSYEQQAKLEVLSAVNGIRSLTELNEFKDVIARYFAEKAQRAIDALCDEGKITQETIKEWGEEHMRTPYRYAAHRS